MTPFLNSSVAIGIDVGGTTTKAALVDTDGNVLGDIPALDTPTTGAQDVAAVVRTQTERARQLALDLNVIGSVTPTDETFPLPIGICVPGIIEEKTGINFYAANLGWHDVNLRDIFSQAVQQPVAIGHDVRSGALAEAMWGVRIPSCLYVAIGTGIATALINDYQLVPLSLWCGEIGQFPVPDPDSDHLAHEETPMVPLETVTSAAGIARRGRQLHLIGENDGARRLEDLGLSDEEGASTARWIMSSAMDILGHTLALAIHVVGQTPIVVGGGLSKGGKLIYEPLEEAITRNTSHIPTPPVLRAKLGSRSQTLGAAALAFTDLKKN